MKKYLLIAYCICLTINCFAQSEYLLKIKLNNNKNYKLSLGYFEGEKMALDTNYTVKNGWTIFTGKVSQPTLAVLFLGGNPTLSIKIKNGSIEAPLLQFFLSNEEIKIQGDADRVYMAEVKGGKANAEWQTVKPELNKLEDQTWKARKDAYDNFKPGQDSAVFKTFSQLASANEMKQRQLKRDFIEKNPGALVSTFFLAELASSLSLDELKSLYQHLDEMNKKNPFAMMTATKIKGMESTASGKQSIPILKKDINGKPVNLETLKGKYVLIDFWGSWCGPCRSSHPHLKDLYAKYKPDGFEIIGIAQEQHEDLNESRKSWLKAIKEDGLSWIQILNNEDIKQFDAVQAYGITAFPTKILLDKEGRIIARIVGDGSEIDNKLKEIFGK